MRPATVARAVQIVDQGGWKGLIPTKQSTIPGGMRALKRVLAMGTWDSRAPLEKPGPQVPSATPLSGPRGPGERPRAGHVWGLFIRRPLFLCCGLKQPEVSARGTEDPSPRTHQSVSQSVRHLPKYPSTQEQVARYEEFMSCCGFLFPPVIWDWSSSGWLKEGGGEGGARLKKKRERDCTMIATGVARGVQLLLIARNEPFPILCVPFVRLS